MVSQTPPASNMASTSASSMMLFPKFTPAQSYQSQSHINMEALTKIEATLEAQRNMRAQQEILLKELRNIEQFNTRLQEDRIIHLILQARKKQRVKKIPPPLEPLPVHLIPKRILDELKVNAPLVANYNDGRSKRKMSERMRTKSLL